MAQSALQKLVPLTIIASAPDTCLSKLLNNEDDVSQAMSWYLVYPVNWVFL
jgi:hypothetical protein